MNQLPQQFIPKRSETIKSLSFTSQFLVGRSSGGEFFDLAKSNFAVVFLSITGPTHHKLALVLDRFDSFREDFEKKTGATGVFSSDILENFLKSLALESLELLLIGIRLQDLHFEAYRFGHYSIISDHTFGTENGPILAGNNHPFDQAFFARAKAEGKMRRGEKWAILSPGVARNLPGGIEQMHTQDYIAKRMSESPEAVMDEVILQMRKNSRGRFLYHDASLVSIEVNPRAIIKV